MATHPARRDLARRPKDVRLTEPPGQASRPSTMNKKLVAVAGCGLVISACASTSRPSSGIPVSSLAEVSASPSATPTASQGTTGTNGELIGVTRLYGGPIRPDGTMALNGQPGSDIRVSVRGRGATVADSVTGSDGTFAFHLAPGRYVLKGCMSVVVVIHSGQTTAQDVTCPVP